MVKIFLQVIILCMQKLWYIFTLNNPKDCVKSVYNLQTNFSRIIPKTFFYVINICYSRGITCEDNICSYTFYFENFTNCPAEIFVAIFIVSFRNTFFQNKEKLNVIG